MSRMSVCAEMIRKVDSTIYNITTFQEEKRKDSIAVEKPIHLFLNKTHYATILCSPDYLKEFVVGHLLSEGILERMDEIQDLSLKEDGRCIVEILPNIGVEMRISMARSFARVINSECGSQNLCIGQGQHRGSLHPPAVLGPCQLLFVSWSQHDC